MLSTTPVSAQAQAALAIANAAAELAHADADELRTRVSGLERELDQRSSELLELSGALLLRHSDRAGHAPQSSPEVAIVRDLFADIVRERGDAPSLVTVVIPVYGKLQYTLRCLRSIAATWSTSVNPTIVVIDDASPDESMRELLAIPGIDILRNGTNLGFLRSSNRGADFARTRYVCFLNNDTEVRDAWLDVLVQAAEEDPNVGAVGSKLIYPDGTLQEAGSIIWSDATGWNFGRGDDPAKSQYNFARTVDYCSAASLLIRTDLLQSIGGFDERYAPAYYEDADLCFEVAFRGYLVKYEPRSEVVHYEGISSGTDLSSGVKRYQDVNRPKFLEKWNARLASHLPPSADNVRAAVYRAESKTILIVDSYVPMHDREAGSNRLFKIIQILRELKYHVIFFPSNCAPIEPYSTDLARLGVEVLYLRANIKDPEELLASVLRRVDVAWICRPGLCERFLPIVRQGTKAPIIYDTIDLHFAREKRRAELEGSDDTLWEKLKETELAMATAADLVVTVTDLERAELRNLGIDHVDVIPTIHDEEPHEHFGFTVRNGIVFIGGYGHTPNVDAALWLCNEIMPIVWQTLPELTVTLLGNNPPESILALRSKSVTVTGFVADVSAYFEESRLFVAPLRYGAGMKGKVGHALSFGLPVVATSVAIEGYDLQDGNNCLLADDAESFARAILVGYRDQELWERLSDRAAASIRNVGREAVSTRLRGLLDKLGVPVAAQLS